MANLGQQISLLPPEDRVYAAADRGATKEECFNLWVLLITVHQIYQVTLARLIKSGLPQSLDLEFYIGNALQKFCCAKNVRRFAENARSGLCKKPSVVGWLVRDCCFQALRELSEQHRFISLAASGDIFAACTEPATVGLVDELLSQIPDSCREYVVARRGFHRGANVYLNGIAGHGDNPQLASYFGFEGKTGYQQFMAQARKGESLLRQLIQG